MKGWHETDYEPSRLKKCGEGGDERPSTNSNIQKYVGPLEMLGASSQGKPKQNWK